MSEIIANISIPGNPLTVNSMYWHSKGVRRYLTSEGQAWKDLVGLSARLGYKGKAQEGRLGVAIQCYFGDKRKRDLDNILKGLFDGLTGIIWVDDSQIDRIFVNREYDKLNPRVEIEVFLC